MDYKVLNGFVKQSKIFAISALASDLEWSWTSSGKPQAIQVLHHIILASSELPFFKWEKYSKNILETETATQFKLYLAPIIRTFPKKSKRVFLNPHAVKDLRP